MRLAYFYLVLGIVVSLVIVSSYAQVPLVAQSGQNTLSVGKISINYLTNNGYESTPAVPKNWQLSFLPLSWFTSAPGSITVQTTLTGITTSSYILPNIYVAENSALYGDSGGEVVIYDDYIYAFYTSTGSTSGSTSGGTLYWASEPFNNYYYNILTEATWTASSYSSITYLGAAILVGNTVYIGAQMSGDAYIIAATLGSGGTISSWATYEIATSGAVEAILYANNEWYVAVGNGPAILYYGSSLSSLSTYAPSGYTYGDIVGLVQTINGNIVVGWYDGSTTVAFAYYNPSSNSWSSVYTISAPSGYYSNDWGILALGGNDYAPMYGYQMATSGNTVVLDLLWDSIYPATSTNMSTYSYTLTTYSYQIGSSSPTLISSRSNVDNTAKYPWLTMYSIGNDIYVAFGGIQTNNYDIQVINVSQNAGVTWNNLYLWNSSSISNDDALINYGSSSASEKVYFYPSPQYAFYNGSLLVFSVGDIPYENPSSGSSTTSEFPLIGILVLNPPAALSSYQISLSNIVPSGSFVKAYPGAQLNTMNLTVTVYQGLSPSSLTQEASQTWTGVSSGSSLSWTTPWLQLPSLSTATDLYSVTITNSQSSATPAPFQQMIYIPSSIASSLGIANNAQNVMFLSSNGSPFYSWFEGNNGTDYIWWIKLPNGIPASSSIQIQMNVTPGANDYVTYYPYVGEAPQLSPTYGQYDNGQYVFLAYANGNTPISDFSVYSGYTLSQATGVSYGSTTINALKLTGYASSAGTLDFYLNTVSLPASASYIAEGNAQWYTSSASGDTNIVALIQSPSSSPNAIAVGGVPGFSDAFFDQEYISSGSYNTNKNPQGSAGQGWVYGSLTYIAGSSTFSAYTSSTLYSPTYLGSTTNPISSSGSNLYLGVIGSQDSSYPANAYWNWLRVRAYPPNGVMPSVSIYAPNTNLYSIITITNSQSSATPAPFQQMIYIPSSIASSLGIANNAQNVMFLSSNGSPFYSWFEGNNGTDYIWWIKLPNGIPASSSIQIQMNVTPGANDYVTYYPYVGEAPQLSPTYGQYDNGQYVFNIYDNFAGTTLSSNWINNGMSVTVNNGVTLTPSGSTGTWSRDSITYNTNVYGTNYVAESYTKITTLGADMNPVLILNSNSDTAYSNSYNLVDSGIDLHYSVSSTAPSYSHATQTSSGSITSTSISMPSGYSYSAFNVYQIYVNGASVSVAVNYSNILNTQTDYNPSTQYLGIGSWEASYTPTTVTLWFRTRAYPPNGVMPSVSIYAPGEVALPQSTSYTNYYVIELTVSALNALTNQPMSYSANVTLTNNLYWNPYLYMFKNPHFYITGGSMTPVLEIPFQAIMLLVLLWIAIIYLIRRDIRMSELD